MFFKKHTLYKNKKVQNRTNPTSHFEKNTNYYSILPELSVQGKND